MKQKTKNSLSKVHVSFTIGVKINKQNPKRQTPPVKKKKPKTNKRTKNKTKNTPQKTSKPPNPQTIPSPKRSRNNSRKSSICHNHIYIITRNSEILFPLIWASKEAILLFNPRIKWMSFRSRCSVLSISQCYFLTFLTCISKCITLSESPLSNRPCPLSLHYTDQFRPRLGKSLTPSPTTASIFNKNITASRSE